MDGTVTSVTKSDVNLRGAMSFPKHIFYIKIPSEHHYNPERV